MTTPSKFVIRSSYIGFPDRPPGVGWIEKDGQTTTYKPNAHRFDSEADAYNYLWNIPDWWAGDEHGPWMWVEPLDSPAGF